MASNKTARPSFRCSECGWTTAKWVGRCGECQAWGTVAEAGLPAAGPRTKAASSLEAKARLISEVDAGEAAYRSSGVSEFDRVLGGGIVPGSVVLLAGEPGIGKSTLVLQVAGKAAAAGSKVLYVTGEESASQVRMRADRIGAIEPGLFLAAETDLGNVLAQIEQSEPDLVIVDSVQTIASSAIDSSPGGVSQVREVASSLIAVAKRSATPVLLVGHVTKDGSIAGPRVLEHLVDVVCQFEGDRHSELRMVRAVKNRFGSTDEVGCFALAEAGIISLSDPSGLFLSGKTGNVAGTCITVTLDGRRPMPVEIQALTTPSFSASPRRTTNGVEFSRVAMALAVLQGRMGVNTGNKDVYVSTVGGARAGEPACDLAIALAIVSANEDIPLRDRQIALGEVGLAGEVRSSIGLQRRLVEAARLGFTRAIVPASKSLPTPPASLELIPVANLAQAAALAPVNGHLAEVREFRPR